MNFIKSGFILPKLFESFKLAKVKGVFLKQAQGVTKVEKAFVKKDSSTVEKIHQSVPTAQFSD